MWKSARTFARAAFGREAGQQRLWRRTKVRNGISTPSLGLLSLKITNSLFREMFWPALLEAA
jgi:hypothetical protein